jgi:hypothetical protein
MGKNASKASGIYVARAAQQPDLHKCASATFPQMGYVAHHLPPLFD